MIILYLLVYKTKTPDSSHDHSPIVFEQKKNTQIKKLHCDGNIKWQGVIETNNTFFSALT